MGRLRKQLVTNITQGTTPPHVKGDVMKRYQVLEEENGSGVSTWQLMEAENQLPLHTVASLPQFATIFPTVF